MRIRNIKPEFWRSADVTRLPRDLRLLYVGLWSYVDDNGVGLDDPVLIASDLFPREDDPVEAREWVREGLQRLSRESRCLRYTVDGKAYLYVLNWKKHQKVHNPNKPRYPLPCGCVADEAVCEPAGQSVSDTEIPEDLGTPSGESPDILSTGSEGQGVRGSEETTTSSSARKRATRIPDDFTVTPVMVAWAQQNAPDVNGRRATEKFINYWQAKGGKDATKVDWVRTWNNWMLTEQERAERLGARASPTTNGTDANIAALLGRQTGTDATILQLPRGES